MPEALAGERLDRAVALLTGWTRERGAGPGRGGRRARRRQRACRRAARSRPASVIEVLAEPAGPGLARSRPDDRRSWCVTRTPTSSSWPSRRGSWCIRAPDTPTARWSTACWRAIPELGERRRPGPPGHRAPARPRHQRVARGRPVTGRLRGPGGDARRPRGRAALRRAGVGRARAPRGVDRRAHRPLGAAPDPHGGPRGRAQRAHRLRGRAHLPRARRRAARVPARDRPHPPDPRAPPGDRPSGGGRRRVRRHAGRRSRSTARSCTPGDSPSRTRSPASRSGWRSRSPPSWWRCSTGLPSSRLDLINLAFPRLGPP